MGVTDIHLHIQPYEQAKPAIAEAMKGQRTDFPLLARIREDPEVLLDHLDGAGVERAGLINYVAPEVMGFDERVNPFVLEYVKGHEDRLLAVGGVDPRRRDAGRRTAALIEEGIRMLKFHPPHLGVAANAYLDDAVPGLGGMYAAAEEAGVPVMVHTGTSVFPGARSRLGDPLAVDDVAVDFPHLTVIMAHGGRPLWCDTAFFLVRRHPHVYLDLSSIPPARLLTYFPRLEEVADKALFGSDWPGPGVPGIRPNLEAFRALPLSDEAKGKILETNARRILP